MKRNRSAATLLTAALAVAVFVPAIPSNAASSADAARRDSDAIGAPIQPMPPDPAVERALARITSSEIQHAIATLVSFRNRSTLSSMDTDLPKGTGVTAAAEWIESQFKEISAACDGCLEVQRDTFTQPPLPGPNARVTQPTTITNVYAILRGTDPAQASRMLLVTGHYDSRNSSNANTHDEAPGANDDASGVAVSLACARALSKIKVPATLVFVAVAGEEQGLLGSKHLAELAKQQGWRLEGVLNNDIVGGNTTPGDKFQDKHAVRVFSEPVPANATPQEIRRLLFLGYDSDSPSRELARAITYTARTYTGAPANPTQPNPTGLEAVLEFRHDRFMRGGDHESFNEEGFPAVRFTEWREDFNHQHQNVRVEDGVQYGDLIKYDDFDYIARVARLNAATMAVLAAAPPPPANVQYPPPPRVFNNSVNDTQITWQNGPGAPADTRYEIVWRPTAAADWQRSIAADKAGATHNGDTWSVTLPVSKDNVVFGVRSFDVAGHRSPAVVPMPATPPRS
ncbi:MAG TPA: M20/M25/M40 family metallo-hydrolase [Acidobacteriaceae bacterium]|nr:M20/M25/M40 family metallo-hydrolase [Acidobacteriaceae bacterium]